MSNDSPIGTLTLQAETQAKRKPSKTHTAKAPCGCAVSASWFSERSRSLNFTHCIEHIIAKDKPHGNE